jgi:uncharacterized protein with NRDE domain
MCLITFAYQQHPEYPLIMVANRDEFYARPTMKMHYWQDHTDILAGRDLEQKGTWLGISKTGKLSAVTNFREGRAKEVNLQSRGHLTRDFLLKKTNTDAYLQQLQTHGDQYGGFNLLLGDTTGLYYISNKGAGSRKLIPGIYGLSNAFLDTPWPKVMEAKQRLQQILHEDITINKLARTLCSSQTAEDNSLPDTGVSYEWEKLLSSCFINTEVYGTRATSVLLQNKQGIVQLAEFQFDSSGQIGEQFFTLNIPLIG